MRRESTKTHEWKYDVTNEDERQEVNVVQFYSKETVHFEGITKIVCDWINLGEKLFYMTYFKYDSK